MVVGVFQTENLLTLVPTSKQSLVRLFSSNAVCIGQRLHPFHSYTCFFSHKLFFLLDESKNSTLFPKDGGKIFSLEKETSVAKQMVQGRRQPVF